MPKRATKAGDSPYYQARMEAASCNDRLNSREGAAEVLGMDRTRLARIELGSLNPYPEEILMMCDAYNAPELGNHFCSRVCPLGCQTVLAAEMLALDRLTIKVLNAFGKAEFVPETMIEIVSDGRVTVGEKAQIEQVISALENISTIATELKLWAEKNLR